MHQDDRRAGGFGCIVNRVDLDALGRAPAAPSLQLRKSMPPKPSLQLQLSLCNSNPSLQPRFGGTDASLQPPSLHHPGIPTFGPARFLALLAQSSKIFGASIIRKTRVAHVARHLAHVACEIRAL